MSIYKTYLIDPNLSLLGKCPFIFTMFYVQSSYEFVFAFTKLLIFGEDWPETRSSIPSLIWLKEIIMKLCISESTNWATKRLYITSSISFQGSSITPNLFQIALKINHKNWLHSVLIEASEFRGRREFISSPVNRATYLSVVYSSHVLWY